MSKRRSQGAESRESLMVATSDRRTNGGGQQPAEKVTLMKTANRPASLAQGTPIRYTTALLPQIIAALVPISGREIWLRPFNTTCSSSAVAGQG